MFWGAQIQGLRMMLRSPGSYRIRRRVFTIITAIAVCVFLITTYA